MADSLLITHPDIAAEWHPTNNGGLKPENVQSNSTLKVWWLCKKNPKHEWQTRVDKRTRQGSGCLYCAGKLTLFEESLAGCYPEIATEWHPEKNGELTPDTVRPASNRKSWWQCKVNPRHVWQTRVANRTVNKTGCPHCSGWVGGLSLSTNSFAVRYPNLAREWHPIKNGILRPQDFFSNSQQEVWWQCQVDADHEWQSKIKTRTGGNTSCPLCERATIRKRVISDGKIKKALPTLEEHCPALAREWHPTLNKDLTPSDVTIGSKINVYWQCSANPSHVWTDLVVRRTRGGRKCPECYKRRVLGGNENLLVNRCPELIKEWHPTKNELKLEKVTAGSDRKAWWICPRNPDHVYLAVISSRVRGVRLRGTTCPYCSGRAVTNKTSLAALFPHVASEWHPELNGGTTPEKVAASSSKTVWWRCPNNPSHQWQAQIRNRTLNNSGCPACNSGWSLNAVRGFVAALKDHLQHFTPAELFLLFQQNGLLKSQGKAKGFVKALTTGRFPYEEIQKFCNGDESLVDAFLQDDAQTLDALSADGWNNLDEPVGAVKDEQAEPREGQEEVEDTPLPVVQTKDVLSSLNAAVITSADQEAVEFLLASGVAKVWRHAFRSENDAVSQAQAFVGDRYAEQVRATFLDEHRQALDVPIPAGYSFAIDGEITPPNLMQRLVASRTLARKRVGNWSGTGAGKTLSAILASRLAESRLTLICCPNSVVSGWESAILQAFPDSNVRAKTFNPTWDADGEPTGFEGLQDRSPRYLVMNYEAFQQPDSEEKVNDFLSREIVDFVVIDEVHFTKQRYAENVSRRKQVIAGLVTRASENNADLHVMGMSATPVINNLQEGRSLVELVTGVSHDDLTTNPTVANCMRLHQRLVTLGARWLPEYNICCAIETPEIDCADILDEIRSLGKNGTPLELEQLLTKVRLPVILDQVRPKTLIYTHYIQGIDRMLRDALVEKGWRVGFYTGEDKAGLDEFINGDLDVLIGSSAIGTGVDGLQQVCNRLIINVLPWTNAEFEQLKGRIYRQGQARPVDVIIPLTYAVINGQRWSWCDSKMHRLKFKKSIADAAVDGVVPEGHLRTSAQAYQDVIGWLNRLETGIVETIARRPLQMSLLAKSESESRLRKYGDFSQMNRRWNQSLSGTTFDRLKNDPEEWMQYHSLYREAREDWAVIPFNEMIQWFKRRSDYVIGDFGCGEAKIAEALVGEHTIHSFDYIAVNEDVVECDMAHVPLEDGVLDAAIFSLSLMGVNFTDYLREAHRTMKLDAQIHIIEATSRFSDIDKFLDGLKALGFNLVEVRDLWKFKHIQAIKADRQPKEGLVVSF